MKYKKEKKGGETGFGSGLWGHTYHHPGSFEDQGADKKWEILLTEDGEGASRVNLGGSIDGVARTMEKWRRLIFRQT